MSLFFASSRSHSGPSVIEWDQRPLGLCRPSNQWKQLKGNPGVDRLIPSCPSPIPLQVEVTESSNQDALSGSSDLLELLLQEDSRSGTGSAASGSLGSGLGSGSGSGSHEGGSASASITRKCVLPIPPRVGQWGVGRPGSAS